MPTIVIEKGRNVNKSRCTVHKCELLIYIYYFKFQNYNHHRLLLFHI